MLRGTVFVRRLCRTVCYLMLDTQWMFPVEKVTTSSSAAAGKLWQLVICTLLASCVAVGELCTVGKLCSSWQAVAVGDLYTTSELCGSG
jgi:hypothetical protein